MAIGMPFPMGILYVLGIIVFIASGLYVASEFEGVTDDGGSESPDEQFIEASGESDP